MSPIDILVVLIVIALVALCVRSQLKGAKEGSCSGCSSSSSCGTHHGGDGHCGVAQKMILTLNRSIVTISLTIFTIRPVSGKWKHSRNKNVSW